MTEANSLSPQNINPKPFVNQEIESDDPLIDGYIIGIGASAGGLDAIERFFSKVSATSGHAYVVVQHLSPDYKSLMAELLDKSANIPIQEATQDQRIEPNQAYLIPSGKIMTVKRGRIKLAPRPLEQGVVLPIDIFFESLALDRPGRSIGIILSGNGQDGTNGMRKIHQSGGLLLAQGVSGAQFDGMPKSAMKTGLIHFSGDPEEMPTAIERLILSKTGSDIKDGVGDAIDSRPISIDRAERTAVNEIYRMLQNHRGIDFAFYKQNTLWRRIEARMAFLQIEQASDYAILVGQSDDELDILFYELLIGVTQFFRDGDAFDLLKEHVIKPLIRNSVSGEPIRVWIPGCSTGEEAYSIAILIKEVMDEYELKRYVKIFATDINDRSIEIASVGIYPATAVEQVNEARRQKYFDFRGDHVEINRSIREMIVFAPQNLLKDPPFSRVDLISCRNVLIYLEPLLQKKALATFRFSLKKGGALFLGPSEMLDNERGFEPISAKWRIFEYKTRQITRIEIARDIGRFEINNPPSVVIRPENSRTRMPERRRERLEEDNTLYRNLLENIKLCTILVDQNRQLVHSFGLVSRFFNLSTSGRIDLDVVSLAQPNLALLLSTGIHKAFGEQESVLYKHVHLIDGDSDRFNVSIYPVRSEESDEDFLAIVFEESSINELDYSSSTEASKESRIQKSASERIEQLERELKYSQENLQATIEELETSNEELQATNEELLASNEELQSTNEELQSVNEELLTVNAEYQSKIRDLTDLNNDISNIFNSTNVGIIFLDERLHIRKFTPTARQEINLIEQDVGRPLSHIAHNLVDCDLVEEAQLAFDSQETREVEVANSNGNWYMVRFIPYRTLENTVKGILITLVDVTILKRVQRDLVEIAEGAADDQARFHLALLNAKTLIAHQNRALIYTWVHERQVSDLLLAKGKSDGDFFNVEDAANLTQLKQRVMADGQGCRQIMTLLLGEMPRQYEVSVDPMLDDEGAIIGVVTIMFELDS